MNAVLIVTFVVVGTLASQVTGLPPKSHNLQARFDDLNHWCYGQTVSFCAVMVLAAIRRASASKTRDLTSGFVCFCEANSCEGAVCWPSIQPFGT
uniref:Secreted protein n=1 Tax=Ixodes ricinus TaxID=34613 RepID=A0A6B0U3P4_IXORI